MYMRTGTGFTKLETDRVRLMLDGTIVTTTSAPSKPSVVTFSNTPAVVASAATTTPTTITTTTTAIPEETILNVIKQARIDADKEAKKLKKKEKDQQSKKSLPSDDVKPSAAAAASAATNGGTGGSEGNKENNDKEKKQVSLAAANDRLADSNKATLEEGQMVSPAAAVFSNRLLALLDQSLANAATTTANTNANVKPMAAGGGAGAGAGAGGFVAITGGTTATPIGPEIEGLRSADQLIDQFRSNFTILTKKMGRAQSYQLVHMLLDRHGLQMNLDMLHDNAMFEEYKDLVGVSGMLAAADKTTVKTDPTKPATVALLGDASSQVALQDKAVIDQTLVDQTKAVPAVAGVVSTTPVDATITPSSAGGGPNTASVTAAAVATALVPDNNPSSTASGLDKMKRKVTFVVLGRGAIQVTPLRANPIY